MPAARTTSRSRAHSGSPETNGAPLQDEVLTLAEAAAYLRVTEAAVLRLIEEQGLPARQVDTEWRLLKPAIQRWLGRDKALDTSKAAQLAVAGSWRNDPFVDEELAETYRRRRAAAAEAAS